MNSKLSQSFILLTALFIASLITSTLLGSKLLLIHGITVSAGLFIFPFTFVTSEIVTEVHGPKSARFLVTTGIFVQLYVLFFVWLGGVFPASPVRDLTVPYQQLFSLAPRMVIASIVAYFVSQFLDIEVFQRLKLATRGKFLWLRANLASYVSQALDTALFTFIFLGGVVPWRDLVLTGLTSYFVKIAVGTLDTPLVYLGVKFAKKLDQNPIRQLSVSAVQTKIYEGDENLIGFLISSLPREMVKEGSVIAITSKIVSLAEGRVVARKSPSGTAEARIEKRHLIEKEADRFLTETIHQVSLTIKHGILIPSAGIDESNSKNQDYILFPVDPYASCARIGLALKAHYRLTRLGIIMTDSHTTPLRNGVSGIGLAHYGFQAVQSLIGKPDLFGRDMKMTQVNILDSLAAAAVLEMGETNDSCPIAILNISGLEYTESSSAAEIHIPMDQDLYGTFFEQKLGKGAVKQ